MRAWIDSTAEVLLLFSLLFVLGWLVTCGVELAFYNPLKTEMGRLAAGTLLATGLILGWVGKGEHE